MRGIMEKPQLPPELKAELFAYKRLIIEEIEVLRKKVMGELEGADPESLPADVPKKPKRIKPICQMQPTQEIKEELLEYKCLILEEMNVAYEKILQGLSVTDRESLATLHEVIAEYKAIEKQVAEKINLMETTLLSWNDIHKPTLKQDYNTKTRELVLSVEVT